MFFWILITRFSLFLKNTLKVRSKLFFLVYVQLSSANFLHLNTVGIPCLTEKGWSRPCKKFAGLNCKVVGMNTLSLTFYKTHKDNVRH